MKLVWTFALVLTLALAAAAPASAETISLRYRGTAYGFVSFGRAEIVYTTTPDGRYEARASIASAGIAAIFANARLNARSHGVISQGLSPSLYELDHRYRGVHRLSSVDWREETVMVRAEPGFPHVGNPTPTEAQRREGRDPLATMLAMGETVARTGGCGGVYRVFDGLYVYEITLSDRGDADLRFNGAQMRTIRCGVRQQRIAGYRRPSDLNKKLPEGEIWFAPLAGVPIAAPVRFTSELPLGSATISLVSFGRS